MSTGQMMMVIGAFMLFGTVSLNFQSTVFESSQIMDSNTQMQSATTIARAIIDELCQYPYDAAFWKKSVVRLSDLTACGCGAGNYYSVNSIGPSPIFDDVDDFNGITFVSPPIGTKPTNVPRVLYGTEGDTVRITVQYVSLSNPDGTASNTVVSWSKRITVRVTSKYSEYPLTMTHIVTF